MAACRASPSSWEATWSACIAQAIGLEEAPAEEKPGEAPPRRRPGRDRRAGVDRPRIGHATEAPPPVEPAPAGRAHPRLARGRASTAAAAARRHGGALPLLTGWTVGGDFFLVVPHRAGVRVQLLGEPEHKPAPRRKGWRVEADAAGSGWTRSARRCSRCSAGCCRSRRTRRCLARLQGLGGERHAARPGPRRLGRRREGRRPRRAGARALQPLHRRRPRRADALRAPGTSPASCTTGRWPSCAGRCAAWASERAPGVPEPEDHIAFGCETHGGADRAAAFPAPVRTPADAFFAPHLRPWAARFFGDLEKAEAAARFYRAVGTLGRVAVEIEGAAADLPA